jgi:selenocysteine lyase/cysteine desulfurase
VDAVHYAPHGLIDVADLECDFLVCSTYKFFGPHMGVLYGKREHLQRLRPYKVRPLTDAIPFRWEWGTLNHECIAGVKECVEYIADLGKNESESPTSRKEREKWGTPPDAGSRRAAIVSAFEQIHRYEHGLMRRLIAGLEQIPQLKLYGITDHSCFDWRCPTLAIRVKNQTSEQTPLALATKLGDRGFFTWDGNYYALNVTERLDVEKSGGFLRIGLVHYNTGEEVDRLLEALGEIVG